MNDLQTKIEERIKQLKKATIDNSELIEESKLLLKDTPNLLYTMEQALGKLNESHQNSIEFLESLNVPDYVSKEDFKKWEDKYKIELLDKLKSDYVKKDDLMKEFDRIDEIDQDISLHDITNHFIMWLNNLEGLNKPTEVICI